MKLLLTVVTTLLCILSFAQQKSNTLSAKEKKEGWKLLFDGETTKGWHSFNKTNAGSAWKVKGEVLYLDTTKKDGWQTADGKDLTSDKAYSNFDLKLEWKISRAGNSGIIFFAQEDGKHQNSWETGPEMQIADNEENEDGHVVKHQAGDLYALISCSQKRVKSAGKWNRVEIISQNGRLTLMVNNVKVISTTMWNEGWKKLIAGSSFKDMPGFGKFHSGKIALQDHGAEVSFRNIKIKEL